MRSFRRAMAGSRCLCGSRSRRCRWSISRSESESSAGASGGFFAVSSSACRWWGDDIPLSLSLSHTHTHSLSLSKVVAKWLSSGVGVVETGHNHEPQKGPPRMMMDGWMAGWMDGHAALDQDEAA
ncbi:hypothetical protein VTK73DRAFT_6364 [Phialemonium thermophilum]|uniref:Uncharacterized protein n=1 Tax=Phialemonium thermophilum TaxID=223376 RepID=A0ABR3V088_9PEZI